jgi:hypothetical protein
MLESTWSKPSSCVVPDVGGMSQWCQVVLQCCPSDVTEVLQSCVVPDVGGMSVNVSPHHIHIYAHTCPHIHIHTFRYTHIYKHMLAPFSKTKVPGPCFMFADLESDGYSVRE